MEYIPGIIVVLMLLVLIPLALWAISPLYYALFEDMIRHRQKVNEIRKKWKK